MPSRAMRLGSDRVWPTLRILVPSMKDMHRMRSLDSSASTSGKTTSCSSRKFSRKRRLLFASMQKSSWANTARPNSSTADSGSTGTRGGSLPSQCATVRMTARSKVHSSTRLGRRTLTATTRPSGRRALCTCATEAEARGTGANSAKISRSGRCRSSSMVRTTWAKANGPTSSCRCTRACVMYSGSKSGRVLMICPTLMKVAPSLRKRLSTQRPNQAWRRLRPAKVTTSHNQPSSQRNPCWMNRTRMVRARRKSRVLVKVARTIAGGYDCPTLNE